MSKSVILHMEPHTKAKHHILEAYLKAWFPIISTNDKRILYLDGFAGSGEYDDGSIGSPIIALEAAKNHSQRPRFASEVLFYFIELNEARYKHLVSVLDKRYKKRPDNSFQRLPSSFKIEPICGEFNAQVSKILDRLEKAGSNLAPTMAFVDPFGYKDIDIAVLGRILKFRKCELLITYMTSFIDRFASDPSHRNIIKKTLQIDDDDIERIASIPDKEERDLNWLKLLNDGIIRFARAQRPDIQNVYHIYFKLMDNNNNTLYYLVYFTKSPKGIEVMKDAMHAVSKNWNYTFSDYNFDPTQKSILDYTREDPWLTEAAKHVFTHFKGQMVQVKKVGEFVLVETIWSWRKGILKKLEEEGLIVVLRGTSKALSYPDDALVKFKN